MPETPAKIPAGESSCDGFGRVRTSLEARLIKSTGAERSGFWDPVGSRGSGKGL